MVVISFRIESKDGRSKKVYMKGKNPLQIFYGFWCKNWSWYPYLEMPNTVSCLLCYISKVFSRRFFSEKKFQRKSQARSVSSFDRHKKPFKSVFLKRWTDEKWSNI